MRLWPFVMLLTFVSACDLDRGLESARFACGSGGECPDGSLADTGTTTSGDGGSAVDASTCEGDCDLCVGQEICWDCIVGSGLPGRACKFRCPSGKSCEFDCGADSCEVVCEPNSNCEATCFGGLCQYECQAGATCAFGCFGGTCNTTCREGARCTESCSSTCTTACGQGANCQMACTAECTMNCSGCTSCGISGCFRDCMDQC